MTVEHIKVYIDEVENKYVKAGLMPIFTNAHLEEFITNLKSMLDELEQKAKWIEIDSLKDCKVVVCENCNTPTLIKKNIVGLYVLPRHCEKCGTEMEVEDDG